MAIKKSELYSSLWQSCDELRGGMDASQYKDYVLQHGQTGSQMNLNTGLINRTKLAVPKDETEQTAIATILSDMDAEITTLETKLAKTRQLKQGMMHNLLTGRIRLI